MVEPEQLIKVREVIAYLKEQNENKESPLTKLSNHAESIFQEYCDKFQHKSKESASDGNGKIRNIINNLKTHQTLKFNDNSCTDKTVDNVTTAQNGIDSINLTNCQRKKPDENVLNNSGEIFRKANVRYLQKPNNKRFKSNHINSSKQLHLTEFYNVVKSVDNHDTIKSKYWIEESQSNSTTLNSNTSIEFNAGETLVDHKPLAKKKEYVPSSQKNSPKSRENTVWHIFDGIKKKYDSQFSTIPNTSRNQVAAQQLRETNIHTQKNDLKGTVFKKTCKRTFDDFCNNIITHANNTLGNSKTSENFNDSLSKGNLRSFSTGNIVSEKESHEDTNSMPLTHYEIKNVKKRLEGSTVDDFIERALRKINDNKENIKSKINVNEVESSHSDDNNLKGWEKNASKLEICSNEERIIPLSSQGNLQHEEKLNSCDPYTTDSENNVNNLFYKTNFSLYKRGSVQQTHLRQNDFQNNQLEDSNEMITPITSQCNDYEKKSQILPYKEKSDNSVVSVDTLEDKNVNISSKTNFLEFNRDSDQYKNLKIHHFKSTRPDIDTYYSQLFPQHVCGEKDDCKVNGLGLILEKEDNLMNDKKLNTENENNTKSVYNNVGTSQNPTNLENSLEERINLLDNDLEKSVLITAYRRHKNTSKKNEKEEVDKTFTLADFLKDLIPGTDEQKEYEKNTPDKCRFQVKRYRKGKTKIYKLKKLKKRIKNEVNEDLNFADLLRKTQPRLSRFKSGSSISTSSSYITDDATSDILSTGSIELPSPQRRLRNGFNELSKDKSLRYSGKEWESIPEHDKEATKMKIQDVFFQILDDFKNKGSSCFKHKRQSFENCIFENGRLQFKPTPESSMTVISSGSQRSKAKFQLMLYILKKVQTLLETDTKLTKRELYYQFKELINDQGVSDRAINAISCLLDVGMWALNIIAQKGLVFGDLKLLLSSGEMLNCNIPGTLIPQDINDIVEIHSTAYFILVVEKESIFHKLIAEDLPNRLTRPFIMITGKGFPDLNTQLFLRKLWIVMSIPVFILVDADPHGINIMLNYRFGSVKNAHVSQHLAVPNAKWLGVYPSEIMNLNIARQPLNEREIKLVNRMLETPYMEFSPKLVDELKVLLTKKFKASIEGLMKTDSYLSQVYLPNKFFTHNFI